MKQVSLFFLFLLLTISWVFASSASQAPANFRYKKSLAVFVDFKKADYTITFNYQTKKVEVETSIIFYQPATGLPIFDLVSTPTNVSVNGIATRVNEISDPDKVTKLRIVEKKLTVGTYTLKMKNFVDSNVVFNHLGVASGFWLGDLSDRNYLEKYIPSNLEYDQFPKKFVVNFVGFGKLEHVIKANGDIRTLGNGKYEIHFPGYYTSSSVFFHVYPKGLNLPNVTFDYRSIDGRILPVDIYTSVEISGFITLSKTLLAELENDYGPFPHDKVLIYGNSLAKGGMEYSGATATGLLSLGHELFHSYNARGVMPANGNSGWMDEAMSRWRDNNYPTASELSFESTRLAANSVWQRSTDRMSYTEGSAFLSLIAHKMNERGFDLKESLRNYFQSHMYQTVTTKNLEDKLLEDTGMDFSTDFKKYIYNIKGQKIKSEGEENPHHPELSHQELLRLTMPDPYQH